MKNGNGRLPSLEEQVNDFQLNYGRSRLKSCIVCSSPNRELIDILMRGGAGGVSISRFLRERFGETISQAPLQRHKALHIDGEAEDR